MFERPFKRTYRPNLNYTGDGYINHQKFSVKGQDYINVFKLIQKDVLDLFNYIEPCDNNISCYSHRIQEIYFRTCIEIEANCTAILTENQYKKKSNLNINDFRKLNKTHYLSEFEVIIPYWNGIHKIVSPFKEWDEKSTLSWYQSYNKLKHYKYEEFHRANLLNLMNSVCGLIVLLSSQFSFYEVEAVGLEMHIIDDNRKKMGIGNYFKIHFPAYKQEEKYDFDWNTIKDENEPFLMLDFVQ